MKKLLLPGLLVVAVGAYFAFSAFNAPRESEPIQEVPTQEDIQTGGDPSFEWSYKAFTENEIPYSRISLTAEYPNGATDRKEIDTIAGGCNEFIEPDADVYPQSTMIICYYAGLGHYYKVVEGDGAYLVQRKVFEEASPEYNPEPEEFEVIAQF
ncbi:MAG TPA: hypothetical protein PK609_02450 [Candidatus Paceibacterota bacterium]|jgi:hypothetical protein|nr:hypothetical protein [Candidatus Paceibacterota bacterium]